MTRSRIGNALLANGRITVFGGDQTPPYNKLLSTGFKQKHTVNDAILEIITAFNEGRLKDEDGCYNIRTMMQAKFLE